MAWNETVIRRALALAIKNQTLEKRKDGSADFDKTTLGEDHAFEITVPYKSGNKRTHTITWTADMNIHDALTVVYRTIYPR